MAERLPLDGIGVLVTRPAGQADGLCAAIEDAGGRSIRFPTLEILEPMDAQPLLRVADRLDDFDMAIFVSPNAVTKAVPRILAGRGFPSRLQVAAIGMGTARELRRFGARVDVCPDRQFDSESLVELPQMMTLAGKNVVIFRGNGGRSFLGDTLTQRGARVDYVEAYRRARPDADIGPITGAWARGEIDVATFASGAACRNLFDMLGRLGQQWLQGTPIVVVSERMRQLATELGIEREPVLASGASDEAIVEALTRWHRATPGTP